METIEWDEKATKAFVQYKMDCIAGIEDENADAEVHSIDDLR